MSIAAVLTGFLAVAVWMGIEAWSVARSSPGKTWVERWPDLKVRLALGLLVAFLLSAVPISRWAVNQMEAAGK